MPSNSLYLSFQRMWYNYRRLVERALGQVPQDNGIKSIAYWQGQLFLSCLIYSLPISLIAVIPSGLIAYTHGLIFIPAFNLFVIGAVTFISFSKHLSIAHKKSLIIALLLLVAVITMASLGSFGIGSIYLLATSVFISALFPARLAYTSIALNAIVYTGFAIIIYFRLFDWPVTVHYSTDIWIGYALNFLFINVIAVIQIRHIINGMEESIREETRLIEALKDQLAEKKQRNILLKESEEHYKSLFFLNPSPMWIFDRDTLCFLQVNDAAISKYGYSQEEFMKMSIRDIRLKQPDDDISDIIKRILATDAFFQNVTTHRGKNGEQFYVEVRCGNIPFQGKQALLAIARDITRQMDQVRAIELQNKKLKEIAFMQSHIIRAPVARIMGLSELIGQNIQNEQEKQLLSYLDDSVRELDTVIRNIVNYTKMND